jgi:cobalt-zinc-cadmium resistance protein CzcA
MSIYFARQLVGERLQEARNQIPSSFGEPSMGPISTGMGLVLFYYLKDDTHDSKVNEGQNKGLQDLGNIFLQDVGGYSSFVRAHICLIIY